MAAASDVGSIETYGKSRYCAWSLTHIPTIENFVLWGNLSRGQRNVVQDLVYSNSF